jgi:hypothetical protein
MEDARTVLAEFLRDEAPAFIPCDRHALDSTAITSPRKTTDSYLADLATVRGWHLATLDEGIAHLPPTSFQNFLSSVERCRIHALPHWLQAVSPLYTKLRLQAAATPTLRAACGRRCRSPPFPAQIRRCQVLNLAMRVNSDSNLQVSDSTKVYILGAGCSVCGRYPLASEVTKGLENFAKGSLKHDKADKLRGCVERTCDLMSKHRVDTIDALARILGDTNRPTIKEAKIAMSAFFFALEDDAVKLASPNYAAFFDELFRYWESPSPSLDDRVKATPCRVLTYNYDRLFERAFIDWAKREEPGNGEIANNLNDYLNMGMGDGYDVEIKSGQFSLLKLHGGIGQFNRDGPRDMGNTSHLYWPKFGTAIPTEFNDDDFYERKNWRSIEPTIIFPHEKQAGDKSSFQGYDSKVWKHAREYCKFATEIHILGYSVQPIDYFWFKSLLLKAKADARIVLRNRLTEKDKLVGKLDGIKNELKAKWTIDYMVEDFFGTR